MCVAQTVVDVLETIEIEEENCEHVIVASLRAFDLRLEQLSKHRPVWQARQRIVKRSVAEVFLCLFQHAADAFLFGDVVVQLLNVSFRLFGAFMFAPRGHVRLLQHVGQTSSPLRGNDRS